MLLNKLKVTDLFITISYYMSNALHLRGKPEGPTILFLDASMLTVIFSECLKVVSLLLCRSMTSKGLIYQRRMLDLEKTK